MRLRGWILGVFWRLRGRDWIGCMGGDLICVSIGCMGGHVEDTHFIAFLILIDHF